MWLGKTVSDGAVLDIFPVHLHMYLTHRLFYIFVFYINFHALCIFLLSAFFFFTENYVLEKKFFFYIRPDRFALFSITIVQNSVVCVHQICLAILY